MVNVLGESNPNYWVAKQMVSAARQMEKHMDNGYAPVVSDGNEFRVSSDRA